MHHVAFADPYDPELRRLLVAAGRAGDVTVHDGGTLVVIQGPRFSTRAESAWFRREGWSVVNMTGYPEAVLAAELGVPYAAIALVTDYDAGIDGAEPVSQEVVFAVLDRNVDRVRALLEARHPRPALAGSRRASRVTVGPLPLRAVHPDRRDPCAFRHPRLRLLLATRPLAYWSLTIALAVGTGAVVQRSHRRRRRRPPPLGRQPSDGDRHPRRRRRRRRSTPPTPPSDRCPSRCVPDGALDALPVGAAAGGGAAGGGRDRHRRSGRTRRPVAHRGAAARRRSGRSRGRSRRHCRVRVGDTVDVVGRRRRPRRGARVVQAGDDHGRRGGR